jgi:hypothetical protein
MAITKLIKEVVVPVDSVKWMKYESKKNSTEQNG